MDEHNAFDLAKLIVPDKPAPWREQHYYTKADLSGRPAPKDVRVQLNSGITVKCDVRYDGIEQDGQRRFLVIAEFDWERYFPRVLWVGEYPRDATLIFRVPEMPDTVCDELAARIDVRPEKIIEVS